MLTQSQLASVDVGLLINVVYFKVGHDQDRSSSELLALTEGATQINVGMLCSVMHSALASYILRHMRRVRGKTDSAQRIQSRASSR